MLKILDEKIKRTPMEIEDLYPNCKYVLLDFGDIQSPKGNLYCISTSKESHQEIGKIAHDFSKKGILNILGGSYDNWGWGNTGVLYEAES